MLEVRFHGRGGQGAVTSAELAAQAAIEEGRFAQAFPSFGPERRGAPVIAYLRISDTQIRDRTGIQEPDVVIVLDPALPGIVEVDQGLKPGGTVILNSGHTPAQLHEEFGIGGRIVAVDANHIAREEIGRVITNTTMLGAFIRVTGVVSVDALAAAFHRRFGHIAGRNIKAFQRAHEEAAMEEVGS